MSARRLSVTSLLTLGRGSSPSWYGGWVATERAVAIALVGLAACARTPEARRAPVVAPPVVSASAPAWDSSAAPEPEATADPLSGLPPEWVAAAPGTPLTSSVASKAAKVLGLKASIAVPHPVKCPVIPKPTPRSQKAVVPHQPPVTDSVLLPVVAIEWFLDDETDVAHAVKILGAPALCNASPGLTSGYMNLHLAPKDPKAHAITIETHDMDMIGLSVDFDEPERLDVPTLELHYGKSKRGPAPLDSFEAGSDDFSAANASYRGTFSFSHRAHTDPPAWRKVHHALFRRTELVDLQAETFRAEADVVRLAAMALQPKMRDAVRFAGTLGGYAKPVDGTITFDTAIPLRNVKSASVGVTSNGERHRVRSLKVTFVTPIAGVGPASFAKALGPMTRSPSPAIVSKEGNLDRIQTALGNVTLERSSGALRSMTVERTD